MTSSDWQHNLDALNARINWERKLREGAMRVDVAPMDDLMERLEHPEKQWRSIHVAGSKGKGSVARLLAESLRESGQRVGLYGSPHVERINERIWIDGDWIADADFGVALGEVLRVRGEAEVEKTAATDATWFDLVTATAFLAFHRAAVDWAVVEVGLGGRLDSTNVIRADLCVITSIALEHTAILGDTRSAIAAEKAGILKPGSVLACGVPDDSSRGPKENAGRTIATHAANLGVYWEVSPPRSTFAATNRAIAELGLDLLARRGHRGLGAHLLSDGVALRSALPGRMELAFRDGVPVALDGAHVASSVTQALKQFSGQEFSKGKPQVVLALGSDKDAEGILKALSDVADRLFCTSVEGSPQCDPLEISAQAGSLGLNSQAFSNPGQALSEALRAASSGGWVLVIGSLHLVGALRGQLDW